MSNMGSLSCISMIQPGLLVAGSTTGACYFFHSESAQIKYQANFHHYIVRIIQANNQIFVCCYDGKIYYQNLEQLGKGDWQSHDCQHGHLRAVFIDEKSQKIATTGQDGLTRIWTLPDLQMLWENGGRGSSGETVVMLGEYVFVGKASGRFEVFNGPGEKGGLVNGAVFASEISASAIHPMGAAIIFGGLKGGMKAISTTLEDRFPQLYSWPNCPPRPYAVNALAFSPNGSTFAAACSDHCIRVFKWSDTQDHIGQELSPPFWCLNPQLLWEEKFIFSHLFYDSENVIYSAGFDGKVRKWNIATQESRDIFKIPD